MERTPKHGDERNRSLYQEDMGTVKVTTPGATQSVLLPRGSYTATSVERYCGWCQEWAVCRNVISWILHTTCGHDWHEAPPTNEGG